MRVCVGVERRIVQGYWVFNSFDKSVSTVALRICGGSENVAVYCVLCRDMKADSRLSLGVLL